MSNIENSVITLKNFIEIFNERKTKGDIATIDVLGEEIYALEHILSEREQDKKRIKELEEENDSKQKAYDDCYCEYKHYKQFESIPVQKVKDKIDKHKYAKECFEKEYVTKKYKDEETRTRDFYMIVAEDLVIINLQELLEDK